MYILGISAYYHDSAVAFIKDGEILFAAQEERFSRIKHDSDFPKLALAAGLKELSLKPEDISAVVFFEKPFLKYERIVETYLAFAPRGFLSFVSSFPLWIKEKLFQKKWLQKELLDLGFSKEQSQRILFSAHHLSHAASAFYASPFSEGLVLTMDGVGEWATTSVFLAQGSHLKKIKEIQFPHSLGFLYSAFTTHCGFKVNSGEYKLMGLAAYGQPVYTDLIKKELVDIKEDGSFRLNLSYFNYCIGKTMTNEKFNRLFKNSQRHEGLPLESIHMDLAASIQQVTEEILLKICSHLKKEFNTDNLCLAGGVALNCVANGELLRKGPFKNIWIQPAAGDAGGSLGAALGAYYLHFKKNRPEPKGSDAMKGAFLGPRFELEDIRRRLNKLNAVFTQKPFNEITQEVARALQQDKAIGWFQGQMEFGPRSLGNRSILGNPLSAETQKRLNLKIKFRESFRPFAPAVLKEKVSDCFETDVESPYMLLVSHVRPEFRREMTTEEEKLFGIEKLNISRSKYPAITHVDYSARLQTVDEKTNPRFHALIKSFEELTECPMLVNTSFNIRGEPIVCTPEDAFRCFMGTDLDILVLEDFILRKEDQPAYLRHDYKQNFRPD